MTAALEDALADAMQSLRRFFARPPVQSMFTLCCPPGGPEMTDEFEREIATEHMETLRRSAERCHQLAANYTEVAIQCAAAARKLQELATATVPDDIGDPSRPSTLTSTALKCDHDADISRLERVVVGSHGRAGVWKLYGDEFTVKADEIALNLAAPEEP